MAESALRSSRGSSGGSTRTAEREGRVATVCPKDSTVRRLRAESGLVETPRLCLRSLDLTPPGEGPAQGDLVGVLQIPADRQPARQSRHPDGHVLNLLGYKERRRLASRVRVGGDHDLPYHFLADPLDELSYPQVLRLDAVQGRESSTEHVVQALVLAGPFDRADIVRILDHAD